MASPAGVFATAASSISRSQMSRGTVTCRPMGGPRSPFLWRGYAHLIWPHDHRRERWRIGTDIHAGGGRGDRALRRHGRGLWSTRRDERANSQPDKAHTSNTNEEVASLLRKRRVYLLQPALCGLSEIAPGWRQACRLCKKLSVGLEWVTLTTCP